VLVEEFEGEGVVGPERFDLTPDEAQEIMDGYFDGFPMIKEYLRAQVERARRDGA